MSQPAEVPSTSPVPQSLKCFAHHHMTTTEYAIWSVCRAMASAHGGLLFFSGPRIAEKFRSMSKNTPYLAASSLSKMGWFKLVKKAERRATNGTFTPTQYRVLTHEEWAAEHPDCCRQPSQLEGMGEETPSHLEETPSHLEGTPSQLEGFTIPESGNKLIPITNASTHTSNTSPSQFEGTALIDRFSKKPRPVQAPAILLEARPSPLIGTELAGKVMSALGQTSNEQYPVGRWQHVVDILRRRGHTPETILEVARECHSRWGADNIRKVGPSGFDLGFEAIQTLAYQGRN